MEQQDKNTNKRVGINLTHIMPSENDLSKINLLLSMQEHPEQYTDEQLQFMINNDQELTEQFEQLALTKQAFVKREVDEENIPVEEEWQKFYESHITHHFSFQKMVACIIGILFTVGVGFAAIHIMHKVHISKSQTVRTEQIISNKPIPSLLVDTVSTDTVSTDTIINSKPIVFDNVTLEKMLPQIATYYLKEVEFLNPNARKLRFYFVWKQDETIDIVLHRLNLFESVTLELKDNIIIVK